VWIGSKATTASRTRTARVPLVVRGKVTGAGNGLVVLRLQRRTGRTYRSALTVRTTLGQAGTFLKSLRTARTGSWRVRAEYAGSPDTAASVSGFAYFKL
jgi:hypothetical protein